MMRFFYNCSKLGKLPLDATMTTSITSHLAFILLEADDLEDDAKKSGFVLYVGI